MAGITRACALATAAILFSMFTALAHTAFADAPAQEMINLPVRLVDAEGGPVAGAVVIPWALRCSQGHGAWREERTGGMEPPTLTTDAEGRVDVPYPRYTILNERVVTTEVTLSIDHPDFACISHEFVNVPWQESQPHTVTLQRGAAVEIVPLENGMPAAVEGLYAMWSDDRSWKPEISPAITADGALRIPPMPAGKGQVLLARLEGERATHLSPFVDVELTAGVNVRERVELHPAVRIAGNLSDNVPRPVKSGRLKAQTVPKEPTPVFQSVDWFTWAPIAEDGTFVIESWPKDEDIQIIALCDGYIAESGEAPAVIENPRDPDPYYRPQVFSPASHSAPVVVRMTPLVRCDIETVNERGVPIANVEISSYPNVGWWHGGSQIYGSPLVRGERLLTTRNYQKSIDDPFPAAFQTTTGADGRAMLNLPVGRQRLGADHDDYELPVVRGRRERKVTLVAGQTTAARLVLQPKGTEQLGDWDKLAGVLFGCTGEQCRRLLNDPGFRAKLENVRHSLDEAEDPTNPVLLTAAYSTVADAFDELEDQEEAAKWRIKAAQQAAKLFSTGKRPVPDSRR